MSDAEKKPVDNDFSMDRSMSSRIDSFGDDDGFGYEEGGGAPRRRFNNRYSKAPAVEVRELPEFKRVTGASLKPDPRYRDMLVSKFINCMMWEGKKSISQEILYDAMDVIADRTKKDALEVFKKAIENVKPLVEVKSKRVGGATYQVPVPVNAKRQLSLAIRWILAASRAKKGQPMAKKLAGELFDAYNKEGNSMKKREDTHKMAEANKAFAHFAF